MIEEFDISKEHRIAAVHACSNSNDEVCRIVKDNQLLSLCRTVVFAPLSFKIDDSVRNVAFIEFPDSVDTSPKQKNFILKWFKDNSFKGFLHLVESNVKFNAMTSSYMQKLESTMLALDYDIHLSTISDKCNYVFKKFCPRITLNVDDIVMKQLVGLPDKISFTSHSNISYMTFNFKAFEESSLLLFDERFTIGMFYIIDFLARRRALKKPGLLYYMNLYLSISDELGAYSIEDGCILKIDQDTMQHENELFKSLDINYAPDNNIDIVLDAVYNKLKSKIKQLS